MKKANMILIGLFVSSLVTLFFINTAVAAYGSVYIYPDGDYKPPQWGPTGGQIHDLDNYWRVAEQTEEHYIYSQIYPCLDKYTMSNPGLSSQYIPQVKMMVYAKCVGGRILSMYMRIDGVTYKKTVTVQGSGYSWYEFSKSCSSGCWTAADINGMRCRVFTEEWDWDWIGISRIKIKVYWNTVCL